MNLAAAKVNSMGIGATRTQKAKVGQLSINGFADQWTRCPGWIHVVVIPSFTSIKAKQGQVPSKAEGVSAVDQGKTAAINFEASYGAFVLSSSSAQSDTGTHWASFRTMATLTRETATTVTTVTSTTQIKPIKDLNYIL